jgi:hypothetical protein
MTSSQRIIASFLLLLALSCCYVAWVVSWDRGEFQVLRVAVDSVHGSDGVSQYLVVEQTVPLMRYGVPAFHSQKLNLPAMVRADYAIKNLWIRKLPADLLLSHPLILVSSARLEGLYSSSALHDEATKNLRSQIGKSYGVVTLSRVGFDLSHTHAVIYAQLTYCGLCGGGYFYFFEKHDGAWKVKSAAMTWIS